uniref:Uncharacterized protein n=1 Tax=viral metagenome TaxID=1070528 RepID=A0A6H1ZA53_9ZZZZ
MFVYIQTFVCMHKLLGYPTINPDTIPPNECSFGRFIAQSAKVGIVFSPIYNRGTRKMSSKVEMIMVSDFSGKIKNREGKNEH